MDQTQEFLIGRLPGTLEELGLDRRAYHLLKRHGIHHVADVISQGETNILGIKGMGGITASHIFSTIAKYLNIEEKQLFSLEMIQKAVAYEKLAFDPLNAPIGILDLPPVTLRKLNALGLFVMRDLFNWESRGRSSQDIEIFSRTEVRRIYTEFNRYLAKNPETSTEETTISTEIQRVRIDMSVVLAAILRDERTIQIVKLRALQLLTLGEIAIKMGGVTRERIRQIIDQVHERIRENLGLFSICCNYLDEIAEKFTNDNKGEELTLTALVNQYKSHLPDARISATAEELSILIAVVRLVSINEKPWMYEILQTRWKNFSFLSCLVTPPIKTHKAVEQRLNVVEEKNKKVSYKELALKILTKEKKPMHWSEIAERAFRMDLRSSFNSSAIYNALMSDPDLFVRVDAGTYALSSWGFNRVDNYPNIIASIMKSQKKALPSDTIFYKVNQIRPIKSTTLTMLLDLHPRFYRSLEKTYGLRAWLPEREKQTLRTPEWLIEESDSYRRLEHASQKGYDVNNILSADLNSRTT